MKRKIINILSVGLISTLLLNGCGQSEEEKTIKEMEKKQEKLMEINPIFGMMMKKEIEQKKEQLNETPLQKEERIKKEKEKEKCEEYKTNIDNKSSSIMDNYKIYSRTKINEDMTYYTLSRIETIQKDFEYSCEILPKYINTAIEKKCISNDVINDVEKITYLDKFKEYNKMYLDICNEFKDIKIVDIYNNQIKLKNEKK